MRLNDVIDPVPVKQLNVDIDALSLWLFGAIVKREFLRGLQFIRLRFNDTFV